MPRYIDADAMLAEAKRLSGPQTGDGWDNWGVYALIERQPTADVAPVRHGHWERVDGYPYPACSECGCESLSRADREYCQFCGARMDGGTHG